MKKITGTFLGIGLLGFFIGGVLTIIGFRNDATHMIVPGIIFLAPSVGVLLGTFFAMVESYCQDKQTKRQKNNIHELDFEIQKGTENINDFQINKPNETAKRPNESKENEKYTVKVGQAVYHSERFGLGTVKALHDKEILIRFKNGAEYKFTFPDAFLEGYLIKVQEKSASEESVSGEKKKPMKTILPQKGMEVVHKYFGIGKISEIAGRYITVCFADKERKFVYPDAFQKRHLVLKEDNKIIQPQGEKGSMPSNDGKSAERFWNIFTEILEENGEPFQFKQISQETGEATKEGGNKTVTIRLLPNKGTIEIIAQRNYYKFEFKVDNIDNFSRIAEDIIVKVNDMLTPVMKEPISFVGSRGGTKGAVNNFIVRYAVSPQNENGIREMQVFAGGKYLMVYDAGNNCVGVVFEHYENRPVPANRQAEICFFDQYYNNYGRWHRMFYGGHQSGERIVYSDLVKEVASKGEYRYAGYIRP